MFVRGFILTDVHYEIPTKVNNSIRVAHLTDLHDVSFGKDNGDLVRLTERQHPDLIFITGDMINRDTQDLSKVMELVAQLKEIAPVYYGLGNHEAQWIRTYGESLITDLEKSGAIVLENSYIDLSVNGNNIRIGGYSGYYGTPHMVSSDAQYQESFFRF